MNNISVIGIYIGISVIAIGIYYFYYASWIARSIETKVIHNMLHLELINDLHNTISQNNFTNLDSRSIYQPIQKSFLSMELNTTPIQRGASFVLFIEKWLLKDASIRKSHFNFYATKDIHSMSIPPKNKYEICQWLETFLKLNPEFIDLELYHQQKTFLCVKKIIKNKDVIDFNNYLSNLAYDYLPGKLQISQEGYLIIEF